MNEMIERVARAICKESGQPWEASTVDYREICIGFARAAIEAMREPTEQMTKAACVEADKHGYYHTRGYFDVEEAEYSWRAMIDAALSPASEGA
ncbi:hypothetical protein [Mesorhizobium sp. URHB0026]